MVLFVNQCILTIIGKKGRIDLGWLWFVVVVFVVVISVVKIASQLAKSDELTFYTCLGELTRVQTRRQRGSWPDRRSASQNRENAVRSDPEHERRDHAF
jgi:hypothetical protein